MSGLPIGLERKLLRKGMEPARLARPVIFDNVPKRNKPLFIRHKSQY